ncbi:MAG: lipopolysaccharide biosynthesis protein [Candidatus Nanopelagicales bacterium]|jgi:O-antigen/teichoic acid export membrane protein
MADGAAAATGPIKPSGVRGSIASHAAMVAVALGIAQVASYAVSVIAARTLGPDGFGVLAALLGILLIGSVLAMGIQAVAARRLVGLADDARAGAARAMLRDGLVGGFAVAMATVAVSPLLVWLLKLDGWLSILLAAATFIPLTWAGAQYGIAQGRESYRRLAAVYALVGLGRGVGGVIGAVVISTVAGTMAGLALGTALGAIAGRLVVAPLADAPRVRLDHFARESAHATHALLALFVLTNVDVLLARALLTAEQAGIYGVGAVIAKVAFWLPQFVGVVAFPRFADARRARATLFSLLAVAGIGALVVIVTAAVPGIVVAFVGGAAYSALVPLAWVFACIGAVFALAQALLLTRLAVDDRRAVIAVWAAAALLIGAATLIAPRTVAGLAASALTAGLALAIVGVIVAVREHRSTDQPGSAPATP